MVSRPSPEEEGRALVERLGGRWGPGGGMCLCPAHDDSTPSLSVRAGRTRLLLHCFAGCSASEVLQAARADGLMEPRPEVRNSSVPGSDTGLTAAARRLWSEARPLAGTAAETYLAGRGIATASAALRYHPRSPFGRWPSTSFRPALIAAVHDHRGLAGVHRTFLGDQPTTAAPVPPAKCALGRLGSGAVRLDPPGPVLGLAEGVETALSASLLFGVPCWATLGAERFGRVAVPDGVRKLLLFLDRDRGGRRAELLARQALASRMSIEAHYPATEGDDWNDVLRAIEGREGRDREVR